MKKRIPLLLSFTSVILLSCTPETVMSLMSESESSSAPTTGSVTDCPPSSPDSSYTSLSSSEERHASGNQTAFFKGGESVSVKIILTNEALYDLSRYGGDTDTYKHKYDDVYFPCTFIATVGEERYVYYDVGVRMKGATSRRQIADASGNISQTCHFKICFKATFDDSLYDLTQFTKYKHTWTSSAKEARKDRRFFGMEKIDFKYLPRNDAAYNGKTYSQEIYSYDLFRQYNIPAPYARWVNFTIQSGSTQRTFKYEAVEAIDKRFLKRALGDKDGDLYKCTQVIGTTTSSGGGWGGGWGGTQDVKYADFDRDGAVTTSLDENGYANGTRIANGKIGVEDNYGEYHPVYSLKTNDSGGENSDFTNMAELINVCYSCCEKGAPLSLLESKLDLTEWLNYCAVSYVVGNYDDFRNNSNNYYIYFRSTDNKAVIIPYDYDYSLGLTKESSVYNHIATDGPFTNKTSHSTINISIFKDTIITNNNLSYYNTGETTQKTMQATYKNKIKEISDNGALDYQQTYIPFISGLPDGATSVSDESDIVSRYMTAKKGVIDALN